MYRKIFVAITLLTFSFFVFSCGRNDDETSLSDRREDEMSFVLYDELNRDLEIELVKFLFNDQYEGQKSIDEWRTRFSFFGTYEGYAIYNRPVGWTFGTLPSSELIGDKVFIHEGGAVGVRAYKDGKEFLLSSLFEEGLVSAETINDIYEVYIRIHSNRYEFGSIVSQ